MRRAELKGVSPLVARPRKKASPLALSVGAFAIWSLLAAFFALGQDEPARGKLVFAYFAAGGADGRRFGQGFQTIFSLVNPGDEPAKVSVSFFDRSGNRRLISVSLRSDAPPLLADPINVDLPARGNLLLRTVEEGPLKTGWVQITASEPVVARGKIARVEFLPILAPCPPACEPFVVRSVAEVQASVPVLKASLEVAPRAFAGLTRSLDTGLAIAYPPSSEQPLQRPANGTLTLFDSSGRRLATRSVTLRPGEQLAALVSELFELPQMPAQMDPLASGGQVVADFSSSPSPVFVTSVGIGADSALLFSTAAGALDATDLGRTQKGFGVKLSIDRPVYVVNPMPPPPSDAEPKMKVRFEVFNFTDVPIRLTYRSGCLLEAEIKNSRGETVIRFPEVCVQIVVVRTLVNDSVAAESDIRLVGRDGRPLPEGIYTIEARAPTDLKLVASASFRVERAF